MRNTRKRLFAKEALEVWHSNFLKFEAFRHRQAFSLREADEELTRWISLQRSIRHMFPLELREKLISAGFDFETRAAPRRPCTGSSSLLYGNRL